MTRTEGWEQLLNDHIERARDLVFQWGTTDCALWCAEWVTIATGEDFAEPWRGRYESEVELNALLVAMDLTGPADIADLALPRVAVAFAQRGDVVLWQNGLGICNGTHSHFLTERGVTRARTRDCTAAWQVR
ncbi:hypothetical protein GobsT_50890 [Gemmata obscuriglobus]|uniref:DUF6950 family protein n=1 Tax=Gemmata obscuriglobus TaxID=114 RepID=UPI00016C4D54|nr:hypothetical protein [Gemmata obscuriglobus]QEG30285.1 hypothetical protein GobsT_50890 [Gemmata obscuriglobus]VTS09609.1 Uncharacterized protein OS=Roseobacter sp. MED193 GN=MED193_12578 PE=4 SV=1 [Gemmata obscuriglobus UQM 2246]